MLKKDRNQKKIHGVGVSILTALTIIVRNRLRKKESRKEKRKKEKGIKKEKKKEENKKNTSKRTKSYILH